MHHFRKTRRIIAVFFVINFLSQICFPTISYALTAGPTAPEATSFEPIDTTDLVDLKTGDFTYNIPLIEVPGPAGGYPLSLSYHAGIQPDQEASWVGLGWTLNPGSISRLVNGYPDDHDNITTVNRTFWEGGETTTTTVGLSYGFANGATVSAGLDFAQDTYKGRGVGWNIGASYGPEFSKSAVGLSVSGQVGVSPYGDAYASFGVTAGIGIGSSEGLTANANIGLSVNTNSGLNAGAGAGVGWTGGAKKKDGPNIGGSLLGASISTDGSKPSLSVGGGVSGVYSSSANNISTRGNSFQVDIPIYYGINLRLGRSYVRYWIDETQGIQTFGSLYYGTAKPNYISAFDTYDLLNINAENLAEESDPEKMLGGSFPDTDQYTVTGQGVGGNIKPYHFQRHLFRQDKQDDSNNKKLVESYELSSALEDKPVEFRFLNDFSNRLEFEPGDFATVNNQITFDFNGDIITGETGDDGYVNNHLTGSKHIEWFTNQEILTTQSLQGFLNCTAEGFSRESNKQIGGFAITNASGVTYHYSLPVYSFDEYMKSENTAKKAEEDGDYFNTLDKPEKYAHSWLLTSVTGPDFVDRNENGRADKDDWGYWVSFEYKKWLNDYAWRNPGIGTNRDLDGEFNFYSFGKKQIYYLEKIITQTHVAVFEKSERFDGREVTSLHSGGFDPLPIYSVSNEKTNCIANCTLHDCYQGGNNCSSCYNECDRRFPDQLIGHEFPRPMLQLNKIKLFNYADYISNRITDDYVIRAIDMSFDYSLATGTPNSYDEEDFSNRKGKLTLKSLTFQGKGNLSLIPPINFDYKNVPYEFDKKDSWGFYKSDFDPAFRDNTNDVIARQTTPASAQNVDAWSLNQITTSLGSSIAVEFESDSYSDVVLARKDGLRVKDVEKHGVDKVSISFWETGINLSDFVTVGDEVELSLIVGYIGNYYSGVTCEEDPYSFLQAPSNVTPSLLTKDVTINVEVLSINEQSKTIVIDNLYEWLTATKSLSVDLNMLSNPSTPDDRCWYIYSGAEAWPDYFAAGILFVKEPEAKFGGGLRVKSVATTSIFGGKRTTHYNYQEGSTTFEPFEILAPKIHPDFPDHDKERQKVANAYKSNILKNYSLQIAVSRQLPGPGVIYKKVKVTESLEHTNGTEFQLPTFSEYEFETFTEDMVSVNTSTVNQQTIAGDERFNISRSNKVVIKDFSARIGNLKSVTHLTSTNELISKTEYNYLHDQGDFESQLLDKFNNQGVVEETFSRSRIVYPQLENKSYLPVTAQYGLGYIIVSSGKTVNVKRNYDGLLSTISKLETYPSIQIGQTSTNYKTGISNTTETLAFDFYSGDATKSLTTDSYGNRYVSETIPAYKKYPQMGLKVYDQNNKHMLSQATGQYSYLVNDLNIPIGLLSASVQTWSNQIATLNQEQPQASIWRKQSSYNWNGQELLNPDGTPPPDGSYPIQDFQSNPFDWTLGSNPKWEKTGELTLYNTNSNALEARDINGNYAATRMNEAQTKVIASASNAKYNEFAFSGSEYYIGNMLPEGGVTREDGQPSKARAHTGTYSLMVPPGKKGFTYLLNPATADLSKIYKASVWVYAPGESEIQSELNKIQLSYTVNGVTRETHPTIQKSKSKSWYLLTLDVVPNGSALRVECLNSSIRAVYFDDFRVHPIDGTMTAYTYDPFSGELTYILDANNFYTKFEYDAMGRLIRTSKELLNFDYGDGKESYRADAVLGEVKYNYGKASNE